MTELQVRNSIQFLSSGCGSFHSLILLEERVAELVSVMEGQEAAAMLDYLAAVPQSGSIGVAGKLGGTEDKRLSVFSLFTASLEPLSYRETMSCIGRWILGGTAACFHEIRFGGAARYRAFYRIFGGSVIGFVGLHADE